MFLSPPISSRLLPLSLLFFSYSCPPNNVVGHRQLKEPLQEIAGEAAPVPELANSQLGLCAAGEQIGKKSEALGKSDPKCFCVLRPVSFAEELRQSAEKNPKTSHK